MLYFFRGMYTLKFRNFKLKKYFGLTTVSKSALRNSVDRKLAVKTLLANITKYFRILRMQSRNIMKHPCCWIACLLCLLLCYVIFMVRVLFFDTYPKQLLNRGLHKSRNIADYVFPNERTNLLEPREICEKHEKLFLLIIVTTVVRNFATRQVIRDTWSNMKRFNYTMFHRMHAHLKGKYLERSEKRLKYYSKYLRPKQRKGVENLATIPVRTVFFVGRAEPTSDYQSVVDRLNNEAEEYHDIIQEDLIDVYDNLTLKSVLILKWILRRCSENAAFILKSDDDTFVNVPNLLHYLLGGTIPIYNDTIQLYNFSASGTLWSRRRLRQTERYLIGNVDHAVKPVRYRSSKWYMPYYSYPYDEYPDFLRGSGYVMSADVIRPLYEMALSTPLIHLEDVFLTGICAAKLNLTLVHETLFQPSYLETICRLKGIITQHYQETSDLVEGFGFVSNIRNRCAPPS